MRSLLLLAVVSASLTACGPEDRPGDAAPIPAIAETKETGEAGPATPASADRLIRPDGIGAARPGITIGGLRAALPPGTTLGAPEPYMVDIIGLPVVQGADTLYHALFGDGEPTGDDALVPWVATHNPAFRTAEGIGPGTTLADAAAAYGAAMLAYNVNDESREYASFANFPHSRVRFRVAPADASTSAFAGSYATQEEYNETAEYDPAARISMVSVDLRGPAPQ